MCRPYFDKIGKTYYFCAINQIKKQQDLIVIYGVEHFYLQLLLSKCVIKNQFLNKN